eukprot:gene6654-4770_t
MALREKTVYNALPKLPQFNFAELNEPLSYGKFQYCYFEDGARKVRQQPLAGGNLAESGGCGIPVSVILDHFPQWKTLDDKVLRFFGYYVEDVTESTIETSRVRKAKIQFYLNNGVVSITETPFVKNSGLRAGMTASPYKADGVDVFSLCIGATLTLRGIDYHLVDCDAFTREFCDVMGMPQPDPLEYPYDEFEARALKPPPPMDEGHIDMRRVVEVHAAQVAGTHASLLTPEERAKARDFYLHDREVLRYYAVWDKRQFRINYYIADGTISVMFDPAENDGRDRNAVFVRRNKIPCDTKAVLLHSETVNRPQGPPQRFLTAEDLRTGVTVDIFTRPFYVYDCDDYTREFYKARGMDMPSFPRPFTEHDQATAKALRSKRQPKAAYKDAQVNKEDQGQQQKFGASSMVFEDHVSEKDPLKMNRFAQDVFRFGARMVDRCPQDAGRKFIVCYYLADDTMSVYEVIINNSGHIGGKIFARRQVASVTDPRQLKVGDSVHMDGNDYILEEMDERTKKYLERGFPEMDEVYYRTIELLAKAQQQLLRRFSRTTDVFRYYASSSARGLNKDNVREVFTDNELMITDEELDNVMNYVDMDHDGWVDLADLTERILNQQFMSDFKPRSSIPRGTPVVARGPIRSAEMIARRANADKLGEEALRHFFILMEARRTLMLRAFQDACVTSYDSNIGVEDFHKCLTDRLHLCLPDEEMGALLYRFFYTPGIPNWMSQHRLSIDEIRRIIRM